MRCVFLFIFRLYCRYAYDDGEDTSFKTPEDELRHFLKRITKTDNNWNKWPPPRFYSESYDCKYVYFLPNNLLPKAIPTLLI